MSAAILGHRPVRSTVRPVRPVAIRRRRRNVALRRRIAAVLTVALVVLSISSLLALRSDAAPSVVNEASVVIAPGETVWDIAYDYAPEGQHPQAYVAEVLRYNDLDAAAVLPGTVLRLPR